MVSHTNLSQKCGGIDAQFRISTTQCHSNPLASLIADLIAYLFGLGLDLGLGPQATNGIQRRGLTRVQAEKGLIQSHDTHVNKKHYQAPKFSGKHRAPHTMGSWPPHEPITLSGCGNQTQNSPS